MFTRGASPGGAAGEATASRWNCDGNTPRPALTPEQHAASLWRTIECEIIPRLMLAHQAPSNDAQAPAAPSPSVGPAEVAILAELVLARDAAPAHVYVRGRQAAGLPAERLFLDLLGPAARRLGALWEADLCDFTQVTVGLWRLQELVYECSPAFQRERRSRLVTRRALLAPAPGSQHAFGVVIVGEFFRRAGWEVHGDPTASLTVMLDQVQRQWFHLVGLSLGSQAQVPGLASAILQLRKASLNPDMLVMVGGPVAALVPDLLARVGADGTASDAEGAVAEAERLVSLCEPPA